MRQVISMPKKKKEENVSVGKILTMTLEGVMEDRFAAYAKDIIQDRALPDARDGLKPAQRRIIYSMHSDGNTYNKPTRKSAKTVGNVIGTLHPHGDSSVYEAMVRMSQDWKMRLPLVEMQGNNGSIDDDPPAAMRYTEARLSKVSELLTEDLDKETVEWAPNYDDTIMEPTVLPARYPNLLVNGAKGIAEGYSTEIAPHNLHELLDASIALVKDRSLSVEDLMQYVKGPDFPTGGIVQGKEGIKNAFTTGRGAIVVRSKVEIVKNSKENQLVITEIPYDVVKSDLIKRINKVRFDKEIPGIQDVIDETDLNGLKVVVELKPDADPQLVLNYLYKKTNLQTNYNYNMVAIVNRCPRQVGLKELLIAFIDHRTEVILRRSEFELKKKTARCHIIEGLIKAVSILDDVIYVIRHSKDKADAKKNLIRKYEFTEVQAEAIVTLQLYRLTNTDVVALEEEYAKLQLEIEELNDILDDKNCLNRVMIRELEEIAKEVPSGRRTRIEDEVEEIVIDKAQMIVHEDVMVTVSYDGYIKRVSMRSYNSSSQSPTGFKDTDYVVGTAKADTAWFIMGFTNQGNYFCLPVYNLEEAKWKDLGSHINKYVKMNNGEKIVDAMIVPDFKSYCWIVQVTEKGKIKRTPLSAFEIQRYSRTAAAFKIAKDDTVIRAFPVYENEQIVLISKKGYVVRYTPEQVPISGTHSSGVAAMKLEKQDAIAYAERIGIKDTDLVILSETCQSKRIKQTEFEKLNRPAKGVLSAKLNKTNPVTVRYLLAGRIDTPLTLISDGTDEKSFKDITLMSKESTYTQPLLKTSMWFIGRTLPETKVIPIPENTEKLPSNDDYDLITLDL